jgi:hypothetical protein
MIQIVQMVKVHSHLMLLITGQSDTPSPTSISLLQSGHTSIDSGLGKVKVSGHSKVQQLNICESSRLATRQIILSLDGNTRSHSESTK